MTDKQVHSKLLKVGAWAVHGFTSLGILACFMALINTAAHNWPVAMTWLLIALVIDGVDGSLARLVKVDEVLPNMNGQYIDYVVDFTSYAVIPAFMFYEAALVPDVLILPLTFMILMVSALYYGRVVMVTEDNYFIGFPVLWNMVMFYFIFIASFRPELYVIITIFLAVLHFVPIKFAYPSRNKRLLIPTLLVCMLLLVIMVSAIYYYPNPPLWIILSAYVVLGYFIVLTLFDTYFYTKREKQTN